MSKSTTETRRTGGRPKLMQTPVQFTMQIEQVELERITALARRKGISRGQLIRAALAGLTA